MSQSNSEANDRTLEILEELFVLEYNEVVKVRRYEEQGSGRPTK
jgi:hypothetical protein